jgi:Bacterial Ig-like domain (group 3)/FG-GAP-like repeat
LADNTVSVFIGNGNGTFQPQVTYGTGVATATNPSAIAVGDFNADGIPDLAVAMMGGAPWPGGVTVLLGVGDGTFRWQGTYGTKTQAAFIAAADFDGDGKTDLVLAMWGGGVAVLLGNGDGTFPSKVIYSAGTNSAWVGVADFNGDGKPDLAVASLGDNTINVVLGSGNGTFGAQVPYSTGTYPWSAAIGDFNSDGHADLVVSNRGDDTVSVLAGKGDGTFKPQITYGTGTNSGGLALGDFNRDGTSDLAMTNVTTAVVSVQMNNVTHTATAVRSGVSIQGTGAHQVDAEYFGDTDFGSSKSSTISLRGSAVATTLSLSTIPVSVSAYGQSLMLTAILSPSTASNLTTNGEPVTFKNGAATIGIGALDTGVATLTLSTLPVSVYSLTAVYGGDSNFLASTSPVVAFTITKATPVVTLSSSASVVLIENIVTFTATVAASFNTPSGPVSFYDGTTVLGSGTMAQGIATYRTSGLMVGAHQITARYGGDGNFSTMTSAVVTETVEDFNLSVSSGSSASATVPPGGTASYELLVSPSGGAMLPAAVTLAVSGLPSGSVATAAPQIVASGAGVTNVALTIQVSNGTASVRHHGLLALAWSPLMLGMLLLPFVTMTQNTARKRRRVGHLLFLVLAAASLAGFAGCGSPPNAPTPPPQKKSYTLTVSATSGALKHSTTLGLTVQ